MEECEGWTLMTHTWQKIHLRYSVIYMYMYACIVVDGWLFSFKGSGSVPTSMYLYFLLTLFRFSSVAWLLVMRSSITRSEP